MPLNRTQIALGIAWIMFWALLVSTALQDYARDGGHDMWKPVLWETSSIIAFSVLLLGQRHYTSRHDHLVSKPLPWFVRQVPWLLMYWVFFVPIAFGIRHSIYALAGDRYAHAPWPQTFLYEDIKITVFFSTFTLIRFGVLSYHAMLEEKLRVERTKASLREAQLLRLTQQMQPHFLFNALNTVSSLMHSDVARADAMLIQLAEVLRATLEVGERNLAPLEVELRLLRGYAQLMAERFSDRVQIDWQIDDALLACEVPVMSMQPLLENIFKHTVERRRQATRILISASREQHDGQTQLVLQLEDDSGTLPAAEPDRAGASSDGTGVSGSSGIGVRNLRERLTALYGAKASFKLIQLSPAGVRAEVRLPCAS